MANQPHNNSENSELHIKKQGYIQKSLLFVEILKKNIPIIWNLHFHDIIFVDNIQILQKSQKLTQSILHILFQVFTILKQLLLAY